MKIGGHLSVSGSVNKTFKRAKDLEVVVHAPYAINPASERGKAIAMEILANEVEVAERIGASILFIHPGSAVDCSTTQAVKNLTQTILSLPSGLNLALETMAGKGNELGSQLRQLRSVVESIGFHVGVCLDTCHIHDAGYLITDSGATVY